MFQEEIVELNQSMEDLERKKKNDDISVNLNDEQVNNVVIDSNRENIMEQISQLNDYIDNYVDFYTDETRMKILNAGIRAMKFKMEKIRTDQERAEMSQKMYNWAATKMIEILSLSKKTAGFLTLVGLFYMYLPDSLRRQLENIPHLGNLLMLCNLIQPIVMQSQTMAAALASGYYILIKSGFEREDIINFIDNVKQNAMNSSQRIMSSVRGIVENMINSLKSYIQINFVEDYERIKVSFTPTPSFVSQSIPALSQSVYDIAKIQDINADLDILLSQLRSQNDEISQKVNSLSQEYSQGSQRGGRRKQYKRRTHRRRTTKNRRSRGYKKRRSTNRRRTRRHRR